MAYWLTKSDPDVFSIDDLRQVKRTPWDGVRNYQARNYLRSMAKGDLVLIYHSVKEPIGVAGLAKVSTEAVPEEAQFDPQSRYYDPTAIRAKPRWYSPQFVFLQKFKTILPLSRLRTEAGLAKMALLQRGCRLSVMPLSKSEFDIIVSMVEYKPGAQ